MRRAYLASAALLAAGLPLVCGARALAAAGDAPSVAPLLVTASHLPGADTGAVTDETVISRAVLQQAPDLASALAQLPDMEVQQGGGRGSVGSIYLRGADPNFTVVMLEGVPLNDPTNSRGGSVNISEFAARGLDRVEVARGPLSGVHGSGALAGVINLMLPDGAPAPHLALEAGGTTAAGAFGLAQWRGPLNGDLGLSVTAEGEDAGHETEGARFRGGALSVKLAPTGPGAPTDTAIFARVGASQARNFPDASGGPLFAARAGTDERRATDLLAGARRGLALREAVHLDLDASVTDRIETDTSPGVASSAFEPGGLPASQTHSRFTRARAGAALRATPATGVELLAGVEGQREDGVSDGVLHLFGLVIPDGFALTRWTGSAFAEARLRSGGWRLDGAVRDDWITALGGHASGRAALSYSLPDEALVLRISAGSAFKAPSFYALAIPLVGNPLLRPETSRSVEGGFKARVGGAVLEGAVFRTVYGDLIDFDPGPPPRLVNRSRVIARGADAAATWTFANGARLSGGVAYVETIDAATAAQLLDRPRWRATAALSWPLTSALTGRADVRWVGARDDFAAPTGVRTLAAYAVATLGADWRLAPHWTLSGEVGNVAGTAYQEAVGFPAAGRTARLSLRGDF